MQKHILVLEQGKLNGFGTHKQLLNSCVLYQNMVAANEADGMHGQSEGKNRRRYNMKTIKQWFQMLSFGNTKKYRNIILWFFLDSVTASLPYNIVIMAIYYLLLPLSASETKLQSGQLWAITGVLALQFVAYFFIRRKTYIDSCVGMADTIKKSRISIGEHLRILPMGFFNERDAGDLSEIRFFCAITPR